MTKDLYTAKDIKEACKLLLSEQDGKCACLGIDIYPDRTPVTDHRHDAENMVRGVIERECNAMLGVTENAYKRFFSYWSTIPLPEVLRRMAAYLERSEDPRHRHPSWIKYCKVQFNKLKAAQQDKVLSELGYSVGTNLKDRKAKFAKLVLDRNLGYVTIVTKMKEVSNATSKST